MSLVRIPLATRSKKPIVYGWPTLAPDSPIWAKVAASVPDCNWGMRLDDFVVADCDSPDAVGWWTAHCPRGTDLISQGRPGRAAFWYLRPPDTRLRPFRLRPDLEIRTGSGQHQVIPPSVHPCGAKYRWFYGSFGDYDDLPLAPEEWLLEQVPADDVWAEGGGDGWDYIPEGHRDIALTSLAGQLRRHGASQHTIASVLEALNPLICKPFLSDDDLARIARSVARYGVGKGRIGEVGPVEIVFDGEEEAR